MKYCIPMELKSIWKKTQQEYQEKGVFFLQREYLFKMNEKTNAFLNTFEEIAAGASDIAKDENAAQYALFLYDAMQDRKLFLSCLPFIEIPEQEFPLLALLSMLPYIECMYDHIVKKEVPMDVVSATIGHFERILFDHAERYGCLGMGKRQFNFMQRYLDFKILDIGRLFFEIRQSTDACMIENKTTGEQILFPVSGEMNKNGLYMDTPPLDPQDKGFSAFFQETENSYIGTPVGNDGRCQRNVVAFHKSEYFLRVPFNSPCISVHIPAQGALTKEACEESYARAKTIFSKFYPELAIKAFRCHSWMMAPELKEILRPGSHILDFQAPYLKCPSRSKGRDVLYFVFKTETSEYRDLPEDTSLQRALKQRYLSGEYLYEYIGIFAI